MVIPQLNNDMFVFREKVARDLSGTHTNRIKKAFVIIAT